MIATCFYHSPNPNEAEVRLLAITQEKLHENVTDEGAIRRCQASHLLAAILYRQGRYSHAESFCRKAIIGRRRLLGKNHISYYESLSLLSQIFEADGQQEDAETYWTMIPKEVASKIVKIKDEFPDTLQMARSPGAGEPSQAKLLPSDNTRHSSSHSETQLATIAKKADNHPNTGTRSQSQYPASSHRQSKQTTQPLSRESTSMKPPASPRPRTTLPPSPSHRSASTPASRTSTTATSTSSETPVQRKTSVFKMFRRRQPSTSSTASTTSTEVSLIQEKENDIGVSRPIKSQLPRKDTSGVADTKPRTGGFLEFLMEMDELENQRDEGNHWPGLN